MSAGSDHERLLQLAELFDAAAAEMRERAGLGERMLADPALADSAALAPGTWQRAEDTIRAATTGRHGLLARSVELDADALVVRATVLTYQWLADLEETARRTLGSIAARAVGYLAPQVRLGGLVGVDLIETGRAGRDDVAALLDELAVEHPEMLEHAVSAGGLLDGLQMRALLASPALGDVRAPDIAATGLAAVGAVGFAAHLDAALRDVAADAVDQPTGPGEPDPAPESAGQPAGGPAQPTGPRTLGELMSRLFAVRRSVAVERVAPATYIGYLPGLHGRAGARVRLVGGDHLPYADRAVRALEAAVRRHGDGRARVLLVGHGQGGPTALEVAATRRSALFEVDRIVTAGAPDALVPRLPRTVRMLCLEDRDDPVALLGSLVNAAAGDRVTVVFDGAEATSAEERYVAGGRLVDRADHPDLVRALIDLRSRGYLG